MRLQRVSALLLALTAIAACGGSSNGSAASGGSSFCDQYKALDDAASGQSSASTGVEAYSQGKAVLDAQKDAFAALVASAPASIKADMQEILQTTTQAFEIAHAHGDDFQRAIDEATGDDATVIQRLGSYARTGADNAQSRVNDYLRGNCPNVSVPTESKFSTVGSAVD
jgi:hypothetical protein